MVNPGPAIRKARRQRHKLPALLRVVLALAAYYSNLTGYLISDDEPGYFYQAWPISHWGVPYRDFLTPQQPGFLEVSGGGN